jgi:hypothetical protein
LVDILLQTTFREKGPIDYLICIGGNRIFDEEMLSAVQKKCFNSNNQEGILAEVNFFFLEFN